MEEPPPNTDVSLSNSSRKIRIITSISNPTAEATNLLISWNLAQLCSKFQEQEVCTLAFQHISDADINELIPKIGPRAIFRARLTEWRQALQKQQRSPPVQSYLPTSSNGQDNRKRHYQTETASDAHAAPKKISATTSNFVEPTVFKLETMDADEQQWLHEVEELQNAVAADAHEDESLADTLPPSTTASNSPSSSPRPVDESAVDLFVPIGNKFTPPISAISGGGDNNRYNAISMPTVLPNSSTNICYSQHNHERVNVKDILIKCYDGRQAIEHYAAYEILDVNHRKKIVKSIISAVIERRVIMTANCFHDLAQQLIEVFPKEVYDKYYVPRIGLTCPRGALYNKYLNMCRRLRREGQLEYRVNKRW